jgi:hypothetical protein
MPSSKILSAVGATPCFRHSPIAINNMLHPKKSIQSVFYSEKRGMERRFSPDLCGLKDVYGHNGHEEGSTCTKPLEPQRGETVFSWFAFRRSQFAISH